jgi:hypothetical protein
MRWLKVCADAGLVLDNTLSVGTWLSLFTKWLFMRLWFDIYFDDSSILLPSVKNYFPYRHISFLLFWFSDRNSLFFNVHKLYFNGLLEKDFPRVIVLFVLSFSGDLLPDFWFF